MDAWKPNPLSLRFVGNGLNGGPGNGGDGRGLARCAVNDGNGTGGHRGELIVRRARAWARWLVKRRDEPHRGEAAPLKARQ